MVEGLPSGVRRYQTTVTAVVMQSNWHFPLVPAEFVIFASCFSVHFAGHWPIVFACADRSFDTGRRRSATARLGPAPADGNGSLSKITTNLSRPSSNFEALCKTIIANLIGGFCSLLIKRIHRDRSFASKRYDRWWGRRRHRRQAPSIGRALVPAVTWRELELWTSTICSFAHPK